MSERKRVAIAGASGLIGSELCSFWVGKGYEIVAIGREKRVDGENLRWQTWEELDLRGCEVVVNLVGSSVFGRWGEGQRGEILESRVWASRCLVEHMRGLGEGERPRVLLQASGIGYGGDTGEVRVSEAGEAGVDFLAGVCVEWEAEGLRAEEFGVRVVLMRKPLVLARGGVAFRLMKVVFSLGLGGKLGDGMQWMPWVHVWDVVAAYDFVMGCEGLEGAVHVTAPELLRNWEFTRVFAGVVGRPAWFGVSKFVIGLVLGGFSEVILSSQRVLPDALLGAGFVFRYGRLEAALRELLGKK